RRVAAHRRHYGSDDRRRHPAPHFFYFLYWEIVAPSMTKRESELRAMFTLATPLVLTELGWMAMGIVDTMFVGRVSAEAIGAVSLGTSIFYAIAIFASGLLLGLDTLV